MIVFPKKAKGKLFPDTVLICNGHECTEREVFPRSTTVSEITHWAKAHGWSVTFMGQGKFRHLCPICDRLTKVPESYIKWAVGA